MSEPEQVDPNDPVAPAAVAPASVASVAPAPPGSAAPASAAAAHTDSAPAAGTPSFLNWLGSLWGYSIARFAMFFALWGLMLLVGLGGLVAAALGLFLSIPLSLVLLARPRARVAQNIERRVEAARASRANLDAQLDPDHHDD